MKKKVLSLLLASAMVLGMAGCGDNAGNNSEVSGGGSSEPSESSPASDGAQDPAVDVNANWDGAYMDGDDFRAYISHDLEQMVSYMEDQLTADQKTQVEAAKTAGLDAIAAAGTVAEVEAAYDDAYSAILACIPKAEGLVSYVGSSYDERADILGIVENYGIHAGLVGMSLYENGGYSIYDPSVTLGTENYIVGYGFGTLSEGAITADLEYESNPDWKRYYHTFESSDPGTLNYYNDQGQVTGDLFGYTATTFYETFMNDTKDGYEWVPVLAKEMPQAVNDDDGDGAATTWRFEVRTGAADGLKYTTGSQMASRAAFNNREVALEDYETPFKFMLTQSNGQFRGSETANTTPAIAGAKDYYNGTADGPNEELWEKVGIRTYVEDGKNYFEVEYEEPQSWFYAMYYISTSLYMPYPQEFIDLVTPQNFFGFNNDATETPVDNSLVLGGYYVETYNQDQEIVFKKNPNYVFADTKYNIEGIHVRIFPAVKEDRNAAFNEFLAGHFHAAGIPQDMLNEYKNDPRVKIRTSGDTVFKLNINATDAETWEQLFGEEGTVTQTPKADYWAVEPALGNSHFLQGMKYSIDRKTYADARGTVPSVNYLATNYLSDPEEGVSYSNTEAHARAIASQLEETDGYGYSLELARDYFRLALSELEAEGKYTPGTAENPTVIELEIAWQVASDEESDHNEIKGFLETAFNDESVSGGKYKLDVKFWVGNVWSDVYYNKMMIGQYDMGMGSVSGSPLNPLDHMGTLSSDQSISNSFTLNWGTDTNDPDEYPIVYNGERYSYDAMITAANSQAIVKDGQNQPKLSFNYEAITKNDDGSYTGALEITASLPDMTSVTPTRIVCCNYERYYNGDGTYDETEVAFEAEDKGNGVTRITFTVPADLAADYATGSGTSAEPTGYTGFDFSYDYTFNGVDTAGQMYSAEDAFAVE